MSEDRPTQKLPKQSRGTRRGQSDLLPDHGKGSGSGGIRCRCGIVSGAVFEEKPEGVPEEPACQVLVAQTGTDGMDEKMQEQSDQELEARMIGEKICSMVGTELVWDKKEKQSSSRTLSGLCDPAPDDLTGWAENFVNVLMDMGIPAYATSKNRIFFHDRSTDDPELSADPG